MTRYACSGCGLRHCDGRCFHESPADYPETEETTSVLTLDDLREMYGNPFGTVCLPDPLKHIEPKKRAA